MYTMSEILPRLTNVTEKNGNYRASCPCHPDSGASLALTERDGKVLAICNACDAQLPEVLQAIKDRRASQPDDDFLALFQPLSAFRKEQAQWVIEGWIPQGQITLLAAEGGTGKTTLWNNIISALSNGTTCILDPANYRREPQRVAFLTTEDSVTKVLKERIEVAGGNQDNIITMNISADKTGKLRGLKFGTEELAKFIRYYRPALCVFDPIQGFIPPNVNMGSRNEMRDCMAQLVALGEETGTTFLVVCHTNKRKGAAARNRISDSSDLWDISRSVIMMGSTEEQEIRYLSNEKNNYGPLQETVLFSICDGKLVKEGTTWKRDEQFMNSVTTHRNTSRSDECRTFILKTLREAPEQRMKGDELNKAAERHGFSVATRNRVRSALSEEGLIRNDQLFVNGKKVWFTRLCGDDEPVWEELPPFDANNPFLHPSDMRN